MIGFLGEYEATLDSKGRFLLPAGFKKQLPEGEGAQFGELSKLNDLDPKVREFRRYFLNGAILMELDSAGRLLVPPNLKEYAGLEKDIVLAAAVNKIEIWDKSKYQQFFETFSPNSFSSLANEVMNPKDDKSKS